MIIRDIKVIRIPSALILLRLFLNYKREQKLENHKELERINYEIDTIMRTETNYADTRGKYTDSLIKNDLIRIGFLADKIHEIELNNLSITEVLRVSFPGDSDLELLRLIESESMGFRLSIGLHPNACPSDGPSKPFFDSKGNSEAFRGTSEEPNWFMNELKKL